MARYINCYLTNRAYGGPEEGGWWFDYGILERSIPVPLKHAQKVLARMRKIAADHNSVRPSINSVSCEGVYEVELSDKPGANWPQITPRYE